MGANSNIEWTDATWNPIGGCSIASPGCTNCYAQRMAGTRLANHPLYKATTTPSKAGPVFNGRLTAAPDDHPVWTWPMRWRGSPKAKAEGRRSRIFVGDMSDLFHEDRPDAVIDRVFAVMALCPQFDFQVLTKRAARMRDYVGTRAGDYEVVLPDHAVAMTGSPCAAHVEDVPWPLPNVWLGVSAERQKEADDRIPDLLATPAAVRFVSAEPLIGPIDFTRIGTHGGWYDSLKGWRNVRETPAPEGVVDWIIAGGESGKDARPAHPDWFRSIRDQCQAAGVAFFFKQWGEWVPGENASGPPPTRTEQTADWFDDHWYFGRMTPKQSEELHRDDEPDVYRVGKHRAGRLLDGREWSEFPEHEAA